MIGVLGDMGGIQGILISILGLLVTPIATHSFFIKASRKLFLAKTSQSGIFGECPSELKEKGREFDEDLIKI